MENKMVVFLLLVISFNVYTEEIEGIPNFNRIRVISECNESQPFGIKLSLVNSGEFDYFFPKVALPQNGAMLKSNFNIALYDQLDDYPLNFSEEKINFKTDEADQLNEFSDLVIKKGEEYRERVNILKYYDLDPARKYLVSLESFFETYNEKTYRSYGITSSILVFEGGLCRNITNEELNVMLRGKD
ncbi:hypothetical protein [Shewanella woodyi]|nr:hypothetical protein [Shewanella woodyi]